MATDTLRNRDRGREREGGGGEEKVRWREKVKFLEFRVVSH